MKGAKWNNPVEPNEPKNYEGENENENKNENETENENQ